MPKATIGLATGSNLNTRLANTCIRASKV